MTPLPPEMAQPMPIGIGTIIVHVLVRLLLMVAGYFVAVLMTLISVVVIYYALTQLPNAPDYFVALALSPIVAIVVPPVGILILSIAVVLTCLPAFVVALLAEIFHLRRWWLHVLAGAVVSAGAFAAASPTLVDGIDPTDWADIGILAAAGLVGGLFYWLIAGRLAGFRPGPA